MVFQVTQLRIRHLACRVRPDRLKDILDRHVVALELPRHDRPAVEHERGYIQTSQRHDGAGDRLVASRESHDRVKQMPARDQFDRVGDDFAADQRGLHPLRAHRDPVGDSDRVVLDGGPPSGPDARFDLLGQPPEVKVAGHDLDPGIRDPHQRPREVVVGEPHRFQHGARRCPAWTISQVVALVLRSRRHGPPFSLHSPFAFFFLLVLLLLALLLFGVDDRA